MGREPRPLIERYLEKVDQRGADECWPWLAARFEKGYGAIRVGERQTKAHRTGYELLVGQIPEGLYVCHTCDNPPCQNPAHWFLGTHGENAADRERKGRGNHTDRGEQNGNAHLTEAQAREIRALCHAGRLQVEIAERFGISQTLVSQIALRKKWGHIDDGLGRITSRNRARGERQGSALLTADVVRDIRNLYASRAFTQAQIGSRFGVSESTIGRIVARKTWRHI